MAQPIRVAGGQQQDVRGDGLIAAKAHEVSHADLLPEPVHVLLLLPGKETAVNKAGGGRLRPHPGGGRTQLGEGSVPPSGLWKISIIRNAENPPAGTAGKNPPANAGETGSIPGPRTFRMPQSSLGQCAMTSFLCSKTHLPLPRTQLQKVCTQQQRPRATKN